MSSKAFSTAQTTGVAGEIRVNAVNVGNDYLLPGNRAGDINQVMVATDFFGGMGWADIDLGVSSPFPAGGATGLVLTKQSGADDDVAWSKTNQTDLDGGIY